MTNARSDTPGIRILPPVYVLAGLAAGYAVWWFWPVPIAPGGWAFFVRLVGGLAAIAAIGLAIAAVARFSRAGTPFDVREPATALVVDGPYRFSRNPMYLGMALFHGGLALLGNALWPLVALIPVVWLIRTQVIDREERYLEARFGDAYRDFKARVRRWL